MSDFDVLFCVVLRFQDEDIDSLDEKVEGYASTIGDCVSEVYTDCFVAPICMEEVTEYDNELSILKNFKFIGEEEN